MGFEPTGYTNTYPNYHKPCESAKQHRKNSTEFKKKQVIKALEIISRSNNAIDSESLLMNEAIKFSEKVAIISVLTGNVLGQVINKPITGAFIGAIVGGALSQNVKNINTDSHIKNGKFKSFIAAQRVAQIMCGTACALEFTFNKLKFFKIDCCSYYSLETFVDLSRDNKVSIICWPIIVGCGGALVGIAATIAGVAIYHMVSLSAKGR